MTQHAKLSASGASRWMACPPSSQLERQFPDKSSPYADEGSFAHEVGELINRYNMKEMGKREFNKRLSKLKENPYYSQELEDYAGEYASEVFRQVGEARKACKDPIVLFEQRLDFSSYVPEGFGTGDAVIIADGLLQIIDLKYGKGVPVYAPGNPQLRLYGLGALTEYSMLYDIQTVRLTIVQPRLESVSTEEVTAADLIQWGEDEVRPKAELAMKGDGDFAVGDHCTFCRARASCRARAEYNMELTKLEFEEPPLLEDGEISFVLERAVHLQKWVKDLQDYAMEQVVTHGKKYEGWKLVEGSSRRKYTDESKVAEALKQAGWAEEDIYTPKPLKGITSMEKMLGKRLFADLLENYVIKPPGKPTLVPDSDSRPEIGSVDRAREDFTEEENTYEN